MRADCKKKLKAKLIPNVTAGTLDENIDNATN